MYIAKGKRRYGGFEWATGRTAHEAVKALIKKSTTFDPNTEVFKVTKAQKVVWTIK